MQTTFALAALAALAYAAPQAVTSNITPTAPAPSGCATSYAGTFQITAVNSTVMKRDLSKRACGDPGSLVITLGNGQLHDAQGRTGYIASNYQFQFDGPPQAGAIYTGGYSVCSNGSLALGGSAIFYECLSGSFYNLYDRHWADQCEPILIDILPCGSAAADPVGQSSDGQPTGTGIATVSQISDGQPQAPSAMPVTEITDGQPQAPTATAPPITEISDGQPQAPTATASAISEISDGQPQAPTATAPAISEISDGQPQAPTATAPAISEISDGQPQAPTATAPAISEISDGQPQAPTATATAPAISEISDGQPQAPTATVTATPISQISDGQPQAPTAAIHAGNATMSAATASSAILSMNNFGTYEGWT
ncbi:hypothetical protein M430DRAFT_165380 [Amorphotheca resinae ATCC 22711]|uniref:Cell wall mannoprotein PIR1-like C-terminal domain-containing protein n=1 Tax=Amorphotheca resinae ATCC 22711 TaxID=857342 RepID=A0A2T3BFZ7_AMORE|nr:hypothetical protein M430DRAFT_165380 [Amorphotheca resinae ATCC 22711]PSS28295.1 hypothetical protein M430DRAFT_165380 [Amorphotheca resinae ATCC 22711]